MLEREEEDPEPREPWAVEYLRAVLADLVHSRRALGEILAVLAVDESVPNRQALARTAAALARRLERDLRNLERDLGPGPAGSTGPMEG